MRMASLIKIATAESSHQGQIQLLVPLPSEFRYNCFGGSSQVLLLVGCGELLEELF